MFVPFLDQLRAHAVPVSLREYLGFLEALNAGLAQWLIGVGLAPPCYVAAQGAALGRAGRVHVSVVDNEIWVGGDVVACIEGRLDLSTCASGADAISPPTA